MPLGVALKAISANVADKCGILLQNRSKPPPLTQQAVGFLKILNPALIGESYMFITFRYKHLLLTFYFVVFLTQSCKRKTTKSANKK